LRGGAAHNINLGRFLLHGQHKIVYWVGQFEEA
jgi:hypothetical protein